MADNINFLKFIVKKIVRVAYKEGSPDIHSPFSEWYRVERITLDDDMVRIIMAEGRHYDLTDSQITTCISEADRIVNFQPQILELYNGIDVEAIPKERHLRFYFMNKAFGMLTLDVVKVDKYQFAVVHSDIAALCWGDIVYFTANRVGIETTPSLCVKRDGKLYPDATRCALVIGRLVKIEQMLPGITHEIIDSTTDFHYVPPKEEHKEKPKGDEDAVAAIEGNSLLKAGKYYAWRPTRYEPVTFGLSEDLKNLPKPDFPPFIATVTKDYDSVAELTVNPIFFPNLQPPEKRKKCTSDLVDVVIDNVCEVVSRQAANGFVEALKVVEPGRLEWSELAKVWVMTKKPKVKIK